MPLAIPIAFVGSVLYYLTIKYMLLRVHVVPEMLSRTLGVFFVNLLPYITLVQAISFMVFIENLEKTLNGKTRSLYGDLFNSLAYSEYAQSKLSQA